MSKLPLSACEAAHQLAQRTLRAEDLVRDCLERIDAREPEVQAWTHVARDAALVRAKALDQGAHQGLLHGLPIGVKDLIATADMPTSYGSPIYAGHQPANDASCVALARAAGAVVLGKTVTTEFATFQPNQTRNPHNLAHTPGGSSSGSAAAVADGMVPLALGTQTAGSLTRPAAYCGVVAFKPSFGGINRAGAKPLSDTLDTVGTLARNVPDAALFAAALSGRSSWLVRPMAEHLSRPLRVGICHTYEWGQALPETHAALQQAAASLSAAHGMTVQDVHLPVSYQQLVQAQTYIQLAEQAQCLSYERLQHFASLSPRLQGILQAGVDVTIEQYDQAQALVALCRAQLADVFQDVDVLLAPSAPGAAPLGLDNTGDPVFCRIWTVLQTPTVNIPAGLAPNGMPVGLQVVGKVGADGLTLASAHALHQHLSVF
ncbi:GatA Asp-tRNAAsn/Glu-tRNAGln amidotransferase A subunit and related amidases [Burkholderiaceae bacterium]